MTEVQFTSCSTPGAAATRAGSGTGAAGAGGGGKAGSASAIIQQAGGGQKGAKLLKCLRTPLN